MRDFVFVVFILMSLMRPNLWADVHEELASLALGEAENYWEREAKVWDFHFRYWSLHNSKLGLLFLPKSFESQAPPVLIYVASDFASQHTGAAMAALAQRKAAVFWTALRRMKERSRSRDLYFLINLSASTSSHGALEDFFHYIVRSYPHRAYDLTTLEKLEAGRLWVDFPSLRDLDTVLTTDLCGSRRFHPLWLQWPVETAARGLLRLRVEGDEPTLTQLKSWAEERSRRKWYSIFSSLHDEFLDTEAKWAPVLGFQSRILSWISPRFFFERFEEIDLRSERWRVSSAAPGSLTLELEFMGDREEGALSSALREQGSFSSFKVEKFIPFRRSFARNEVLGWIDEVYENYPNSKSSHWMGEAQSSSSRVRALNILSYDFSPLMCEEEAGRSQDGRALDIVEALLQKIAQ